MTEKIEIIQETRHKGGEGKFRIINTDVKEGDAFNRFFENLSASMPGKDKVNLRDETIDIMMHCNPHNATTNDETTHLVVGYVQSGKTMSFTALTALAHDNGYKMIVYLAGTKNNLLNQTEKRLSEGLEAVMPKFFKIHPSANADDIDSIAGHLCLSDKPTVLIPILKNYLQIEKFIKLLKTDDIKEGLQGETVLIIDDEADQASLNACGRKNSEKDDDEEDEKSATYNAILKMRAELPANTYIQYTATPQANILIDIQDLLSPRSHTLLTPGSGYVGGKLFFGKGPDGSLYHGGLIREIPVKDIYNKKSNPINAMPQSLKDALMLHILAVAITVKWKEEEPYFSMMVHADKVNNINRKFKKWIDSELKKWRRILRMPDGELEKEDLLSDFRALFPVAIQYYDDNEKPTFDEIKKYLPDVVNDKGVYLVNTDKDSNRDIKWEQYCMHILVGGEMLNRGFTVEKLTTTYMPRTTKGPSNADTIEQRCRFYGYKKDYIKDCRVFLPVESIEDYNDYIDHEEELRSVLAVNDNLEEAERKIMLSERLRPTRSNVLPVSIVNSKLKGMCRMQAFESKSTIEHNNKVVKEFLERHANDFTLENGGNSPDRRHRGLYLSIDEALDFLNNFRFQSYKETKRKSNTMRYLKYLSTQSSNPIKNVCFYEMAWQSTPRKRKFDFENKRLMQEQFLSGRDTQGGNIYPGDAKIVDADTITIQLHHLQLEGVELGFPQQAYALAINYPEQLAINYCANEGPKQHIDD